MKVFFLLGIVALIVGGFALFASLPAPSLPLQTEPEASRENNVTLPQEQSAPTAPPSTTNRFIPSDFRGPSGPPHIIGPSGPPPDY